MCDYAKELFNNPNRVPYSIDIVGHKNYLAELAKGKNVVELGVRCGFSTACFLTSCESLTSYDVVMTPEAEELQAKCSKWKFIKKSSLDVIIPDCDILFIDTLHTYTQLLQELTLHHRNVKQRIVMHDTNDVNLKNAIKDFISKNPKWSIEVETPISNGLTTLLKSS